MRKKFIERLTKEGFEITFDHGILPEDTIYLTMNSLALCDENDDLTTYKKAFEQRIFGAGGEKFNYPFSLSVEEYFEHPFFPAVFKNESTNAGKDKFLIETKEQLEIIKRFYKEYGTRASYKEAFNYTICQQFIDTPTNYKTYMRVLMSASGKVMGASLKYSVGGSKKRETQGIFENHFLNKNSEYYLNCQGMFGYYSGGENISFTQPRYSTEKQAVLEAHEIDPENPELPEDVVEVAKAIASKCNKELGIICGIDFIQNVVDGKWYYLENQAFPAIDEWATANRIKVPIKKDINNYLKYLSIDLEARYASLVMCMEKKNLMDTESLEEKGKTKILK